MERSDVSGFRLGVAKNENSTIRTGSLSIRVRNLRKIYYQSGSGEPVIAIERLNFTLQPGDFACIVGRTGCGKSTFLNIMAGLEDPSEGEISIGSKTPYGDFDWFKEKMGIIFQQDRLLPWRTALSNVELGLELLDLSPSRRRSIAKEWLVQLGLRKFLNAYPGELSGGMRQRVAMARAFALDPEILLADEAFGHLDEVTAAQLRRDFLELARKRRTTVVLVTHQLDEAIEVAERLLVFGKPARLLGEIQTKDALGQTSQADLRREIQDMIDDNKVTKV